MAGDTDIPVSYLRECFELREDGSLVWKTRPREHFANNQAWSAWNSRYAGQPTGKALKGYLATHIIWNGKKRSVLVHRIGFALKNGRWPDEQIDHRNGRRNDNRPINLREANRIEQGQNLKLYRNNTSGFPGVCWDKARGRWQVRLNLGGRGVFQTRCDSFDEACSAYLSAKQRFHSFQPELRECLD